MRTEPVPARTPLRRTYQLFVGGRFRRSEAGRTYHMGPDTAALATGADVAAAVAAAGKALAPWSGRGPARGRALYRLAELWESRGPELVSAGVPEAEQAAAVDRWLWYAGWPDKLGQVLGSGGWVDLAGDRAHGHCGPAPCGVAGLVVPDPVGPLGLASLIGPALAAGAPVVALMPPPSARLAAVLAEAVVAAEIPAGTVNLLTGDHRELAPVLAGQPAVAALDLTGVDDPAVHAAAAAAATARLASVRRPPAAPLDWTDDPGLDRLSGYLTGRTIWQSAAL